MSYLQQGFSRHSDSVKSSQNPSPFPLQIRIKIRLEVYYGMLIQMIKLCHFKLDCKSILMFIKDVERAICWSSCTITELSWDGGARVWSHCWPALCTFGHLWTFWSQVIDSFMKDEKKQRTNLSIVKFATSIAKALLLREAVILTNTLSIPFQC